MTIQILGTPYTVKKVPYEADPAFKERSIDGYCDELLKRIVICDMSTFPGMENEPKEFVAAFEKSILRHEIVHSFLNESGLSSSTVGTNCWSKNEEMIDWFAIQGEKIVAVWNQCETDFARMNADEVASNA